MTEDSNLFLTTLQKHRGGGLLADASAKLAELVAAVHATGKKGHITVRLSVIPASAGKTVVTLTDEIERKLPKQQVPSSLWFTTAEGSLVKDNPDQAEMAFPAPVVIAQGAPESAPLVRAAVS